jgi:hypothetical protein
MPVSALRSANSIYSCVAWCVCELATGACVRSLTATQRGRSVTQACERAADTEAGCARLRRPGSLSLADEMLHCHSAIACHLCTFPCLACVVLRVPFRVNHTCSGSPRNGQLGGTRDDSWEDPDDCSLQLCMSQLVCPQHASLHDNMALRCV